MAQPDSTIHRLQNAIHAAAAAGLGDSLEGAELFAAAGEALGLLKTWGNLSVSQLMYDFARLAGQAGDTPSDFSAKANPTNDR